MSGYYTKYPDNMQSVQMNWKVSIWCKKCPDNLKNISGYSKKGLDDVEMYLENLEGSGWSRKCPLNSENCTDNLKRVRMIKKYAWVIWIFYKCTLWSIFGPLLCLKFANTLFTRICRKFEKWCNLRVLSGKFLQQQSCYPESFCFFWLCWEVPHPPFLEETIVTH